MCTERHVFIFQVFSLFKASQSCQEGLCMPCKAAHNKSFYFKYFFFFCLPKIFVENSALKKRLPSLHKLIAQLALVATTLATVFQTNNYAHYFFLSPCLSLGIQTKSTSPLKKKNKPWSEWVTCTANFFCQFSPPLAKNALPPLHTHLLLPTFF